MRLVAQLVCLAVFIPSGGALAGDADSTRTTHWAVRFEPYGFSGAGLDRKLSERWELGIEVDGDREDGDRDSDSVYREDERHDSGDDDDWSVSIRPELRRWWRASEMWRGFVGARLSYGASSWNRNNVSNEDRSREAGDQQSIGCAFTLGVETLLWRSLSLQAAFAPLSVAHSWTTSEDEQWRVDENDDEYFYGSYDETEKSRIVYSARPQVYLVLRW